MTLGNMRRNGVRGLFVTCLHCGHHTEVNVDAPLMTSWCHRSGPECGADQSHRRAAPRTRQGDGRAVVHRNQKAAQIALCGFPNIRRRSLSSHRRRESAPVVR
jgi:hypothetical protein